MRWDYQLLSLNKRNLKTYLVFFGHVSKPEMEKYWEWRELDDNWTIGFEDGRPHFQHKYGSISYKHFDYKIEDGKTYLAL